MFVEQQNQRVLIDYCGPVKWTLSEASDDGRLFVEGKCGQAGAPTANGRVYPRSVMEREISRLQSKIKVGSLVGSLDHPGDGKSRLKDAAHIVRSLWIKEDGAIHGKFEIVEECDNGRNLAAFLRRGATIGMSSRGMGSTKATSKGEMVGEDFKLATFDFVAEPAVSDAFPSMVTEDEEGRTPTIDDLRIKYPELVHEIEEGAYNVAQTVCENVEEAARESLMTLVAEETIAQYKEKIRGEVQAEARVSMVDEFGLKLTRALQSLRQEIEEEVRADLKSDPTNISAKMTLENIAKQLVPFNPPKDVQGVIAELEGSLDEVSQERDSLHEKATSVATTARTLAWQLYVERAVRGRDDADVVIEMVGNLETVHSSDELKDRLQGAIEKADAMASDTERRVDEGLERLKSERDRLQQDYEQLRRQTEKRNREVTETIQELTKQIHHREEEFSQREESLLEEMSAEAERNTELLESLEEAKALAEELKAMEFAQRRTRHHPRRKAVLGEVKRRRIVDPDEINDLAEEFEDRAEEPGGLRERIRRRLGRGREHTSEPLEESGKVSGRSNGASAEISDLTEMNVAVEDILATIKRLPR